MTGRDDGLIYIENANSPLINKIEKALHRIFKSNHLKIIIEQKGHTVNFLDVTLGTDGSYKPYKKPNGITKYVNKASNHPPSILKNIPKSMQKRLNAISSSEDEFGGAKDEYQNALGDAGYTETLTYDPNINKTHKTKRKRSRRIIWYNPPYCKNVATNIGKEFFKLLCLHFPKQHFLHRLFNDNAGKLSYSCMPSMHCIVKAHSTKILRKEEENKEEGSCSCRDRTLCPVENQCLRTNIVYMATVQYDNKTSHYLGMTENSFDTHYTQHTSSLRHSKNKSHTELSSLV